ncbi:hypothetical protein ACFFRR_002231 [Megaselia abdita]
MDSEPTTPAKSVTVSEPNSPETSEASSSSNSSILNSVQINGRRIRTLDKWLGSPPGSDCEVYVSRIPRHYDEESIIQAFQRFGQIYEVRFMLDFDKTCRGYCYVRYVDLKSALRAKEVMGHFITENFNTFKVSFSFDKCRLFIGNIPKEIDNQEIESELRHMFPKIKGILMRNKIDLPENSKNRGFVFIDFHNHEDALEVKKLTTPGRIRKWDRDLRVVWANPECQIDPEAARNNKTLFIRNINMSTTRTELFNLFTEFVDRVDIRKVCQTREYAFVQLLSRNKAEYLLGRLDGLFFNGFHLKVEWALPPSESSIHSISTTDFCQVLRLKCIANAWSVPKYIYGQFFETESVQYVAIVLTNELGQTRIFFAEIKTNNVTDIQSRVSEALIILIERLDGCFPKNNYVVKIRHDDNMHVVGTIDNLSTGIFSAAFNIIVDFAMYLDEFRDLSIFGDIISKTDEEYFFSIYKKALSKNFNETFLEMPMCNGRFLTAITPKFRNKPPLKHDLNNSEVILCLCNISTKTNYKQLPFRQSFYHLKDIFMVRNDFQYGVLSMTPHTLTQSKTHGYILDAVRFDCAETCNNSSNATSNLVMAWENVVPYSKSILQSEF